MPPLPDIFDRQPPAGFRERLRASDPRLDVCCLGADCWLILRYDPDKERIAVGRRALTWMRPLRTVDPAMRRQAHLMAEGWSELIDYTGPEPHDGVRIRALAALSRSHAEVEAALRYAGADAQADRRAERAERWRADYLAGEARDRVRHAFRKPVSIVRPAGYPATRSA